MSSINSIFGSSFNEVLIFRALVVEPWRIITAIHTRDPEKDLHMKGQAETKTGKREGDLKGNRPENSQRQDSASSRNPSRRSEHQDAQSGSNRGNYYSHIDSRQPISNSVLERRIDCLENAIKQIAAHMGLFQRQDQHGDNSRDVDRNSASGACGNEDEARKEQ